MINSATDKFKEYKFVFCQFDSSFIHYVMFNAASSAAPQIPLCFGGCHGLQPKAVGAITFFKLPWSMYIHNVKSTSTLYWGRQSQLDRRRSACCIAFELMCVHVVQEGGLTGARGQPPPPHPQNELGNKVPRGEECNSTGWKEHSHRWRSQGLGVEGSSLKRRGGWQSSRSGWRKQLK